MNCSPATRVSRRFRKCASSSGFRWPRWAHFPAWRDAAVFGIREEFSAHAQPGLAAAAIFRAHFTPYLLRERLLQPEWMLPADAAFLRKTFADYLLPDDADMLSQAMYFEATANLTGDMLVKVDRMSMANSLEVRCPLLDHELAEVAAAIPHRWKIRHGRGKDFLIGRSRTACRPRC